MNPKRPVIEGGRSFSKLSMVGNLVRLVASHMKRIRLNPMLACPAFILSVIGVVTICSGMHLQPWGIIAIIAGLRLRSMGRDLSLTDDGIKFGFTKISWDSISCFDFDSGARIVIVIRTGVRQSFTLTRWHYHPSDWQSVRERLLKVSPPVA